MSTGQSRTPLCSSESASPGLCLFAPGATASQVSPAHGNSGRQASDSVCTVRRVLLGSVAAFLHCCSAVSAPTARTSVPLQRSRLLQCDRVWIEEPRSRRMRHGDVIMYYQDGRPLCFLETGSRVQAGQKTNFSACLAQYAILPGKQIMGLVMYWLAKQGR